MRQRLERVMWSNQSTTTISTNDDKDEMTESDSSKYRGDLSQQHSSSAQHHQHTMSLELEMESEREGEADHVLVANKAASSPVRERTRAAHHNGSAAHLRAAPSPTLSTFMSFRTMTAVTSPSSNLMKWIIIVLSGICLVLYSIPSQAEFPKNKSPKQVSSRNYSSSSSPSYSSSSKEGPSLPQISYACPSLSSSSPIPKNRDDPTHGKWYDQVSQQLLHKDNLTDYLQIYRHTEFDNWGKTYEQVKHAMRDWKLRTFAPVFDDPNRVYSMYESACGIGLNLALTTEILFESTAVSLQRLEVHGNDYVQASVTLAEHLYEQGHIVDQYKGTMGRFCAADSTHLEHVPSDSFDIVFTGYITPLTDPLSVANQYDTSRDVERAYQAICENKTNPELVQHMQGAQESFYLQWVEEMIRLARPGAPVIVEQVSLPLCEAYYDWGGVPQEFWKTSMAKWPVDASSLLFEDDTMMRGRYHVYFRKKESVR